MAGDKEDKPKVAPAKEIAAEIDLGLAGITLGAVAIIVALVVWVRRS